MGKGDVCGTMDIDELEHLDCWGNFNISAIFLRFGINLPYLAYSFLISSNSICEKLISNQEIIKLWHIDNLF